MALAKSRALLFASRLPGLMVCSLCYGSGICARPPAESEIEQAAFRSGVFAGLERSLRALVCSQAPLKR